MCLVLTREPLPAKKGQEDSSSSYEASTTKEAIAYALFITNLVYLVRQQCLRSSYVCMWLGAFCAAFVPSWR